MAKLPLQSVEYTIEGSFAAQTNGEALLLVTIFIVVVVVFYYCDMGEDCYNCYILKTGSQLTPRAIVGL